MRLLSEVLASRPDLQSLLDMVALGHELNDSETDTLEEAIHSELIEELDENDEPSGRGRALDELLGVVAQLRRGYYDAAE
jgi:hypothetical protein